MPAGTLGLRAGACLGAMLPTIWMNGFGDGHSSKQRRKTNEVLGLGVGCIMSLCL
jgi:hypothetical protein